MWLVVMILGSDEMDLIEVERELKGSRGGID
jgi:hypothetical protein